MAGLSGVNAATSTITIVLLRHNSAPHPRCKEVQCTQAEVARHLADPARVDCPATAKLGMHVVLVPTTPGRRLFTGLRGDCTSNRFGTWAAIDPVSGFAPSDVCGDVYMVRANGQSLSLDEWSELDNSLGNILDAFGDTGSLTNDRWKGAAANLKFQLKLKEKKRAWKQAKRDAGEDTDSEAYDYDDNSMDEDSDSHEGDADPAGAA